MRRVQYMLEQISWQDIPQMYISWHYMIIVTVYDSSTYFPFTKSHNIIAFRDHQAKGNNGKVITLPRLAVSWDQTESYMLANFYWPFWR